MKFVFCFFLFFTISVVYSQNLVLNSNFEEYTICPTDINTFTTTDWTSPFFPGSPNYFNICSTGDVDIPINFAGNQEPLSGGAYIGIYTYGGNNREFIQGVLKSPTIADETYELSIIYSSSENFGHSDGLGMLLSVGAPISNVGQIPQLEKTVVVDSQSEWHTINYEYLSPGGETHLTIGNFNNDFNSNFVPDGMYQDNAYYYIDSVTVRCKGKPSSDISVDIGEDVEVCTHDYPYTIVNNLPNAYNEWSTGETGASIDIFGPGTYFVKSSIDCRFGVDTIVINTIEEPEIVIEDTIICAGSNYTVQLDSELGDYNWSNGSVNPEFLVPNSGSYSVTLTHSCGIVEESFTIDIENGFENVDLVSSYSLCMGEPLVINISEYWEDSILWNDGSTDEERVFYEPGIYSVKLTNTCIDTTLTYELKQKVCSSETIYVPNIFSPNGDGINDYISIYFSDTWPTFTIKFSIYSRWGDHVFYTEDPNFRWYGVFQGMPLNPNIFVFSYEIEFEIDGKLQLVTGSGDITIVK